MGMRYIQKKSLREEYKPLPLPSTAAERQLHSAFHSEFAIQGTLLKLPIGKTLGKLLLKVTQSPRT